MNHRLVYRPEIDGLRTFAVLSVLIFHATPSFLSGGFIGVDIFFVISGFLIGSILLEEFDRTGQINYVDFWARRTRRLTPAAILVIVTTLLVSTAILPPSDVLRVANDSLFAALYVGNWQNLIESVSYFEEGGGESLFLHYWSLAVEEQFYIYIISVFCFASFIGRTASDRQKFLNMLIIAIAAVSLFISIIVTSNSQPEGFFGLHSRLWQLSLGIIVAMADRIGVWPMGLAKNLLLWIGFTILVIAAIAFDGSMIYPGKLALIPTLGTAFFLWACLSNGTDWHPLTSALSARPVVQIGRLSYALYLWHWPIFLIWQFKTGHWNFADIVGAIFLTFALAFATHKWVENPIRFSAFLQPRPKTSLGLLGVATMVTLGFSFMVANKFEATKFYRLADGNSINLELVRESQPRTYADGCHVDQTEVDYETCVYGDANGSTSIYLFGDSHAAQWFPTLDRLAMNGNLALYSRTKSACAPINIALYNTNFEREYTECAQWRTAVLAEIIKQKPDIVFIGMSSRHRPFDPVGQINLPDELAFAALVAAENATIEAILGSGAKVVLLRDTPWLPIDPLDCLASSTLNDGDCAWQVETTLSDRSFPVAQHQNSSVFVLDLTSSVCPNEICSSILDGIVTYRDKHHLSVAFAEALTVDFLKGLNQIGIFER